MKPSAIGAAAVLFLGFMMPVLPADDNIHVLPHLASAQWREDLKYFARELPKRHANAFHHIPRERFEVEVAKLDGQLEHLDADQIYAGLDRIACLIGDGHTFVRFPDDTADMPLSVGQFGGEFRVTHVVPGFEKALGSRVLKVEGVPVERVHEFLHALTPQDETASLTDSQATNYLTMGIVLHGLRVTPSRDIVHYTLSDDSGREFTIESRALAADAKPKWITAFRQAPLFRQRPAETFWYQWLPESRTVYCNFRSYKTIWRHARELLELVDSRHPDKLVIDMRQNGGGDYTLGLKYLIRPLKDRPEINKKGHLFVLIGPHTFSAAMSNSAHFRAQTAAILVGQPIGERPNSYQEARQMKLPNSGLIVRYSVRYYKFVENGENEIRTDKEIIPTWAEYKAGRDPVLEWVLKYSAK